MPLSLPVYPKQEPHQLSDRGAPYQPYPVYQEPAYAEPLYSGISHDQLVPYNDATLNSTPQSNATESNLAPIMYDSHAGNAELFTLLQCWDIWTNEATQSAPWKYDAVYQESQPDILGNVVQTRGQETHVGQNSTRSRTGRAGSSSRVILVLPGFVLREHDIMRLVR